MQQSLRQDQIGQSQQMVQQTSMAQGQQQMAQITQQQIAQSQMVQQQMAHSQMNQQQIAQSQMNQQQMAQAQSQLNQQQMAQSQLNQQQMSQSQINQQQLAQSQLAQQQMAQSQMTQQQMAQTQMAQHQMAQSQLAQQQLAQSQIVQQQLAQQQLAQQQINQPQLVQQHITQPQMIQQQIAQQQLGQQHLQQMMYCPTVRFVYDSPVQLMQSGDQIQQQNQNIFVNQPPWARPVQNQVIFVQQIGNNLVPVQHIDPNMFLQQNIPMYQQVIQNVPQLVQNLPQTVQGLPQGQIRQIINNIPAGIMPNFGANVQRIPEHNLGQMVQNFGLIQANTDVNMSNVNVGNNEADRQTTTNQTNAQQNAPTHELMQVYRQIVPQINQQVRAQVPVSQQQTIQNVQTGQQIVSMVHSAGANIRPGVGNVNLNTPSSTGLKVNNNVKPITTQIMPNNSPNTNHIIKPTLNPNVSTAGMNVGTNMQQIRHIIQAQNVNAVPQSLPQNMPNVSVGMQSFATSVGTLNTVTYSAVRNGQPYTYRAIQPKPNNTNNIRVNFKPRGTQMPMVRRPVAPNVNQNVPVSTNTAPVSTIPVSTIPASTIPASTANYIKMETESSTFNRKRKSESPDEVHKKISNYGSITVTAQVKDKIKAKYANTSEIGVNTSPVHKLHKLDPNKVENKPHVLQLQINPMEAKIKQEFLSPTSGHPQPIINSNANVFIKAEAGIEIKDKKVSKDVSQQTEEKHVRKTVFPQAKATGRLLDAKTSLDMPKLDEPAMSTSKINITNNESTTVLQMNNEPKNINNFLNNENQQTIQIKNNQNDTLNQNGSNILEETKNVNHVTPMLNTPVTAANVVDTQKAMDTPIETSKTDSTKVETKGSEVRVETNVDMRSISQSNPQNKFEPSEIKNVELKIENSATKDKIETEVNVKQETVPVAKIEPQPEIIKEVINTEPPVTEAKVTTETDLEEDIKDNKIEKKEYKNISINEISGKEIHIVDGNIHKEERDFVLTHVLDGFVIQESNVPFAIRRPLKEKTVNAYVEDKTDPCIKAAKEEIRGQLSQLHINESIERERIENETRLKDNETEMAEKSENDNENLVPETKIDKPVVSTDINVVKDNPFESLMQKVVKMWTVDDLVSHLNKHNWTETVSILQEHEIDGFSLFLVNRTQLVTIGISEDHADVICEFIGSKS